MKQSKKDSVWIVIPAQNEAKRVGKVVAKTKKLYRNVIVVDDGSTDSTARVARNKGAIVLTHVVNLGKGGALTTGCKYAISRGATIIVALDADLQHDPDNIKLFVRKLKSVDIVFGFRELDANMPAILKFGNNVINTVTKVLYNMDLKDSQCGFRAFKVQKYKKIQWQASDYSMESEMIANAGKYNLSYAQVPIATIYKDKYKGTTVFDGIKIVLSLFWWKLKR